MQRVLVGILGFWLAAWPLAAGASTCEEQRQHGIDLLESLALACGPASDVVPDSEEQKPEPEVPGPQEVYRESCVEQRTREGMEALALAVTICRQAAQEVDDPHEAARLRLLAISSRARIAVEERDYSAAVETFALGEEEIANLKAQDPSAIEFYESWSEVEGLRGEYARSRAMLQRALVWRERSFGTEDPRYAEGLVRLGFSYHPPRGPVEAAELAALAPDLDQAEAYYRQAIHVLEDTVGLDSPRLEEPLFLLADVLRRTGRNSEAERLMSWRRSLGTREADS